MLITRAIPMVALGTNMSRNGTSKDIVRAGVGWLAYAVELLNQKDILTDDEKYCKTKAMSFLAWIFLPEPDLCKIIPKMRTKAFVPDDTAFGMQMLQECVKESPNYEDYLYLSLHYYKGEIICKDLQLAKQYYDKAVELDTENEITEEFSKYYESLLK